MRIVFLLISMVILVSPLVVEGQERRLEFFELVIELEKQGNDFRMVEGQDFKKDSGGIAREYGVTGWIQKNGYTYIKVYRDYLKTWQEKQHKVFNALWVPKSDFDVIFNTLLTQKSIKLIKDIPGYSEIEPISAIMTSSGNIVTFVEFQDGNIKFAKQNMNPRPHTKIDGPTKQR